MRHTAVQEACELIPCSARRIRPLFRPLLGRTPNAVPRDPVVKVTSEEKKQSVVDGPTLDRFEALFKAVNALFPD